MKKNYLKFKTTQKKFIFMINNNKGIVIITNKYLHFKTKQKKEKTKEMMTLCTKNSSLIATRLIIFYKNK